MIASTKAEDYLWGVPESPEFSIVQTLLNEFRSHESDEARCIEVYGEIARESDDPVIGFLLSLIVSDEERHHQILGQVVSLLKNDLSAIGVATTVHDQRRRSRNRKELAQTLERLLKAERYGIGEYERLAKTTTHAQHELLALICKTMVHDALKHMAILEYLRGRLSQAGARKKKARSDS